ncbi:hypothetical protein D9757_006285 [Collybiopsis confluens]|uniref:SAGA-associated factor 11 n=1 Tax=Collybiopsis confluens TaxID=2823264 RepID=A0A8H5HGP7_9AGAR|nr:hypothetical protein D9757_006285 [Collybiopsis confluens]
MPLSKVEKAERDQILQALSTKLFCDILDDFVMDIALEAHAEVSRSRVSCETCAVIQVERQAWTLHLAHLSCIHSAVHVPASANQNSQAKPSPTVPDISSGTEGRAGTPNGVKGDGMIHLKCVNCERTIASNRYAPHLSSCMGLNNSRRGAVRGTIKSKQSSDAGRSGSPASEAGYISDEKSPQKSKGKSKAKRVGQLHATAVLNVCCIVKIIRADEAEFNLKRKRPISPQISPSKKQKQKGTRGPVTRVDEVSRSSSTLQSTNSQSKIPSKLRDSSTAPLNDSNSSRESSPDASLSSALTSSFKNKGLTVRPPPVPLKQPSPPRAPVPFSYIDHDDGGDETGSSTDPDSS